MRDPNLEAASRTESQRLDALAEEFAARRRRGESPAIDEYALKHPDLAERIRSLFPSLELLERVASPAPASIPTPATIGEYRIVRELGRGGMGVVLEAEQPSLGRRVALKLLPVQATLDARFLARFAREAQAVARLQHPNIVSVYGTGEHQGLHFFSMQYVDGHGLDQVLKEQRVRKEQDGTGAEVRPERDFREVARIGAQVAGALAHAHAQGIVHRDVKPSNLLLDRTGNVWVTDFGLCKAEDAESLTGPLDVLGTLRYMAPECLNGISDGRSDVYSLGMTLYELATLRFGFEETNRSALTRRIVEEMPVRPRRIDPAIPPDLETIILKAIAKNPDERYATASAFALDLQAFLDGKPISAQPPRLAYLVKLFVRRNRTLTLTIGAAALIIVLATTYYVLELTRALHLVRVHALAGAAEESMERNSMLGLLLAREAVRHDPIPTALTALHRALAGVHERADLPHDDQLSTASFSPDGNRIVTASADHTARLWTRSGKLLGTLVGHGGTVSSAVFSHRGDCILTASFDQTARLWNADGKQLAELKGHTGNVYTAVFSPDDEYILTASEDATARLWDRDGIVLSILSGHRGPVRSAEFSPDGGSIVTASRDTTARLWSVVDGEVTFVRAFGKHDHGLITAKFSNQGDRIVTASGGGRWFEEPSPHPHACVWNLSGDLIADLAGHGSSIESAEFSGDGASLLTASLDRTARIWDIASGREILRLQPAKLSLLRGATFSPSGEQVLVYGNDGAARLYDLEGLEVAAFCSHESIIWNSAFAPDGKSIVTASQDKTARTWDLDSPELPVLRGHRDSVVSARFSPDGSRIATASRDHTARLWTREGVLISELRGHAGLVYDVGFSPDGSRLVTASTDTTARIWDLNGKMVAELRGHDGYLWTASFSRSGTRVLTAGDTTARIWDLQGHELQKINAHDTVVTWAEFSPKEDLIVTASWDGTARLFDAQGRRLRELRGHRNRVHCASFSPSGDRIVTASSDNTAILWDLQGNIICRLLGHDGELYFSAFSPDGQTIVTASHDGTAKLWNLHGEQLATLSVHGSGAVTAVFSPDGQRVITSSWDKTARLWMVRPEDLLQLADKRAFRDFTGQERDRYKVLLEGR